MKNASKILAVFVLASLMTPGFIFAKNSDETKFWKVQSIDTMKYSRDLAREKLNDRSFDKVIDGQIKAIADTGATHVAIATPYDSEFAPFLKRWVVSARKHGLKVWFRGNFSGWEGWFGYSKISREEHTAKTEQFILKNKGLFEDGDIFTACPECENGGPGDPRLNRDIDGHRKFLIKEHKVMANVFKKINRDVIFNYNSMNGDVAFLIMNKATTSALGGVITIDHYVKTQKRLISDIKKLSAQGGGAKIVLGEFGAPIPDIHGNMSEIDQAKWIQNALSELISVPELVGVNYWVNIGGSTALWDGRLVPRSAVSVLKEFFAPAVITGFVKDELGRPIEGVEVKNSYRLTKTRDNGYFELPYYQYKNDKLNFSKSDFVEKTVSAGSKESEPFLITLERTEETFSFRFMKLLKYLASILYLLRD